MSKTNLVLIIMHIDLSLALQSSGTSISMYTETAKVKIFTILWWNAFLLISRDCSCYPVTITSSIVILLFCFPQMGFSWVINLPNLCRMHLEICSHKSNRGWKNLLPVPLECRYSQSDSDCTSVLSGHWEICVFLKILYYFLFITVLYHFSRQVCI